MKKLTLSLIVLASIFLTQCKSKKPVTQSNTPNKTVELKKEKVTDTVGQFKIKILRISCASLVAVILDEKYKHLGEEWVPYNVRMKEPYKNVVNVANKCFLPDYVKMDDVITVKLLNDDEKTDPNCVACMMMDYPPSKSVKLKFISILKGEKK